MSKLIKERTMKNIMKKNRLDYINKSRTGYGQLIHRDYPNLKTPISSTPKSVNNAIKNVIRDLRRNFLQYGVPFNA